MKSALIAASGALALVVMACSAGGARQAEHPVALPQPSVALPEPGSQAVAVLAGGCFWGIEAVFEQLKGVKSVTSGYAGGTASSATYDQVSSENTAHAEAVRIVYDPQIISYGTLLRIHFSVAHDPTQYNRQGPDSGPSYRSAIFPQSTAQDKMARGWLAQLGKANPYGKPVVTKIESGRFYPAEAYHQDFARNNPRHAYIVRWDAPKIKAVRAAYPNLVR